MDLGVINEHATMIPGVNVVTIFEIGEIKRLNGDDNEIGSSGEGRIPNTVEMVRMYTTRVRLAHYLF